MDQALDQLKLNFDTESLWMVNITLAIIMFGVALDISVEDFKRLFRQPKKFLIGVLLKFFLLQVTTFLFVCMLKPLPSLALGLFMVAACPGGNVSNFMTKIAKGDVALSISLTAFATVMALIMTPLNLAVWANFYEPTSILLNKINISPVQVAKIVFLIMGIPLFLGMLIRKHKEVFAVKLSRILKPASLLILIIIIIVASYNNLDNFVNYLHYAFFLVVGLNALLFVVGFYVAKMSKLPFKDQKTLSIETGIQNTGLGLMLVFLFFSELGGMALVVGFWGIWDIFSGLVLSYYWSKK